MGSRYHRVGRSQVDIWVHAIIVWAHIGVHDTIVWADLRLMSGFTTPLCGPI
jgi:hypothetical protein